MSPHTLPTLHPHAKDVEVRSQVAAFKEELLGQDGRAFGHRQSLGKMLFCLENRSREALFGWFCCKGPCVRQGLSVTPRTSEGDMVVDG